MASFIGGVYTSGWTIDGESQSPDPSDHVDDRGNIPVGWLPPFVKGSTDRQPYDERAAAPWFHDQPGAMSPAESFDVLPEDVPWWERALPKVEDPAPNFRIPKPDFGFGGFVPGTIIPTPKGFIPDVTEKAQEVLPDLSVPGFSDLGAIVPLMLIMTIAKD